MGSLRDLPDLDFPVKSNPITPEDAVLMSALIAGYKKQQMVAAERRAKRLATKSSK